MSRVQVQVLRVEIEPVQEGHGHDQTFAAGAVGRATGDDGCRRRRVEEADPVPLGVGSTVIIAGCGDNVKRAAGRRLADGRQLLDVGHRQRGRPALVRPSVELLALFRRDAR